MKVKQATAYALHSLIYMIRHVTQPPVSVGTIAKAEGIPAAYLAKIFQKLTKANIVKTSNGSQRGYVFAREPKEIMLLELFELIEGGPLFDECFMKHCNCGGTVANCSIYSAWSKATKEMKDFLAKTNLETAAWSHPEHRFDLPTIKELSPTKETAINETPQTKAR
jgi:Rrf2 family protein